MNPAAPPPDDEAYDQWLVIRAQGGEEAAFRELVDRWSPRLRRHATRLADDPDGGAEVEQEAWLAIVRGLARLDDPACFRRWAYRIVTNKCADWVRRRQASRTRATPLDEEPVAPPSHDGADDRVDAVRAALRTLPERDRTLLAMHYTEQMAVAEIAEAIAVPEGTVKSRLYHARQRLKEVLGRSRQ